MADITLLREKLRKIIVDPKQVDAVCLLFESMDRLEEEERRKRQMDGIKRAKEEGKRLGRPKIREPEDFMSIAGRWERKEITAHEAAESCEMGTSTFYRRVRALRDKLTC